MCMRWPPLMVRCEVDKFGYNNHIDYIVEGVVTVISYNVDRSSAHWSKRIISLSAILVNGYTDISNKARVCVYVCVCSSRSNQYAGYSRQIIYGNSLSGLGYDMSARVRGHENASSSEPGSSQPTHRRRPRSAHMCSGNLPTVKQLEGDQILDTDAPQPA